MVRHRPGADFSCSAAERSVVLRKWPGVKAGSANFLGFDFEAIRSDLILRFGSRQVFGDLPYLTIPLHGF